ncbi:MAG: protein-tyrosine phosphatase family protein [Anaerolineales bacterium]
MSSLACYKNFRLSVFILPVTSSPPLPPYSPTPHLLCGPYPHDPAPLLASGVTCLIDLTEPGEVMGDQLIGDRLIGDRLSVHQSTSNLLPITNHQSQISNTQYLNFPIPDFSTPTPSHMTAILNALDVALAAGHTVYLHCHGGRGRTGTVVGCWLVRHGMTGEQALARIAELRGDHESPETEEQRAFVLNWKE